MRDCDHGCESACANGCTHPGQPYDCEWDEADSYEWDESDDCDWDESGELEWDECEPEEPAEPVSDPDLV